MDFDTAQENFVAAARLGIRAQFGWPGHHHIPGDELILEELLPVARDGLKLKGIVAADVDRYLGIIEERVRSKRTGAQWQLESYNGLRDRGTRGERLAAITGAIIENQKGGQPVTTWPLASLEDAGGWEKHFGQIEQFMTTDLITTHVDEAVELVANLMQWKRIRHVPVEDNEHRLVGLVSQSSLIKLLAERATELGRGPIPVKEVMSTDMVTVSPETRTVDAIRLMRQHHIGCLPVLKEDRLVGIVTEFDFLVMAGQLLEQELGG
ncbi:MAG: CBS domain-containing protein [Thermoanaerobaculia bacterium]